LESSLRGEILSLEILKRYHNTKLFQRDRDWLAQITTFATEKSVCL
jgi:hypothetical protein